MNDNSDVETESDDEKSARMFKENENKVSKIEDKTEENAGMYRVYQFFMAASVLMFLLGVVCIALLIYQYVQANNSEERPLLGQNQGRAYPSDGMNNNPGRPGGFGPN